MSDEWAYTTEPVPAELFAALTAVLAIHAEEGPSLVWEEPPPLTPEQREWLESS